MKGNWLVSNSGLMKENWLWLWWCLWVCFCFSFLVEGTTDSSDSQVMAELAKNLNGVSSWTGNDPCGGWKGISCSSSGKITGINIQGMGLKGSLPTDFNKLSALSSISMQKNSLSGPLPSFSGMANLQSVFLGNNAFESIPTDFFDGLTTLQTFSIDDNGLLAPWSIPDGLASAVALTSFSANNASIVGELPEFFGNGTIAGLQTLRLAYNNLNGTIPASFNASSSLQVLWLNNQNGKLLGGSIEPVGAMNQLTQVWLHVNAFTGPVPDFKSPALFDVQLRDNQFTGPVPESLLSISSLNVSLKNNDLQGPYPNFNSKTQPDTTSNNFCTSVAGKSCDARINALLSFAGALGYPSALAKAWTGNDPCANWLFVTCTGGNVSVLSVVNRQLTGTISPALSSLTSLTQIILSGNSLTGSIPAELTKLPNLKKLDVSNNQLWGTIPTFGSGVTVLTDGNSQIGKSPAPGSSPSGTSSGSSSGSSGSTGKSNSTNVGSGGGGGGGSKTWIAGAVIGIVALVLVVGLCYCYISRKRQRSTRVQSPTTVAINPHRRDASSSSDRELLKISIGPPMPDTAPSMSNGGPSDGHVIEPPGSMVISIQVLREVTDNFSDENILGRGGFGVVYRGELHDGTKIAVKRMEAAKVSSKGLSEFQAEIAVLTKVRHRHLVALLGYCIDGGEKMLVYEYMPQGPLSFHLFEWAGAGLRPLEWKQRLSIALDVARGVEYLHSLAQTSFIHRDLKPSNILLGDDMRAKVSDFGLVKLAPDGKFSVETRLAGTFGYLAPEYAVTGRVTTKVDVFSFGVVLMELITGRRALDETQPEESMHLVTWFRRVLASRESFRKAVDPVLDMADDTFPSICTVAELAGHCTAREPFQRPDMGHAVNVLSPLVEQWKPANMDSEDCYGIDLDMPLSQALKRWQAVEGGASSLIDEGHSLRSLDNTQTSIPNKPSGFADSFQSADCR